MAGNDSFNQIARGFCEACCLVNFSRIYVRAYAAHRPQVAMVKTLQKFTQSSLIICYSLGQGEQEAGRGPQHLPRFCHAGGAGLLLRCGLAMLGGPSQPRYLKTKRPGFLENLENSPLSIGQFIETLQ